jgi:hypothetical protein
MPRKQKKSWIYEKYSAFLSELQELNWLMTGCQIGLGETINPMLHSKKFLEMQRGQNINMPDTFVPLLKKMGFDSKESKEMANFLRKEFVAGFQFMYRIWTVMLWSILENYIRDFLVEWIKRNPDMMKTEVVQKLSIRFGEYEALLGDEKYEYIVDMVESQSKLGIGVARFEVILGQFGLSGKVNEKLKKNILELQQVRHVLVHRNGIVDKRLAERCPWIVPNPGKTIFIDSEIYQMYFEAVANYAVEVGDRAYKILYKHQKQN